MITQIFDVQGTAEDSKAAQDTVSFVYKIVKLGIKNKEGLQ